MLYKYKVTRRLRHNIASNVGEPRETSRIVVAPNASDALIIAGYGKNRCDALGSLHSYDIECIGEAK